MPNIGLPIPPPPPAEPGFTVYTLPRRVDLDPFGAPLATVLPTAVSLVVLVSQTGEPVTWCMEHGVIAVARTVAAVAAELVAELNAHVRDLHPDAQPIKT